MQGDFNSYYVQKTTIQLKILRCLVATQVAVIGALAGTSAWGLMSQTDKNVPLCFSFNYFNDANQFRLWSKASDTTWEERYPDGSVTQFRVIKRGSETGFGSDPQQSRTGTIVRRSDNVIDVFIPDKNTDGWAAFRVADGVWHKLNKVDFH